jgi:aldehyde dehydrogenase (NAD+)
VANETSDTTTYPISQATAAALRRPLFGHVIDGEVVESVDGGTMPVIDPASGRQIAIAAAGSQADVDAAVRSARAAFDEGRWRFMAPLEKERRLRRLADLLAERADLFGELDVLDAGLLRLYTTFIVEAAVNSVEYFAGWPSKVEGTIPPCRPSSPSMRSASRSV